MNDKPDLDDVILGTALRRAIETQSVPETPFERSRLATQHPRSSRGHGWPLAAAAALVLAIALGVGVGRSRSEGTPTATQPTVAPAPSPQPSAGPQVATAVPTLVYFARDGLPPVAGMVAGHAQVRDSVIERLGNRIGALFDAGPNGAPAGARNLLAPARVSGQGSRDIRISIDGDTASIELKIEPPLAIRDASEARLAVQQLVYTATEDPPIRQVRLSGPGGGPLVLGGFSSDTKPLAREDVMGYAHVGVTKPFQVDGTDNSPFALSSSYSVDSPAPGLARFVINVAPLRSAPVGARLYPSFTASLGPTTMPTGKYELEITVENGSDTTTAAQQVDHSPLRWIAVGKPNSWRAQTYRLGLDDQRPWRVLLLFDPTRIVFDIGGPPQAISDDQNTTVYAPAPGADTSRTFTLSGAARAFEATVAYRVRDDRQNVLVAGAANASIGTSALWGGYEALISLPASASGAITVEVFQRSPKDGSEASKVTIPLLVR